VFSGSSSEAKRLPALEDGNGRLKRSLVDAMPGNPGLNELLSEAVTRAAQREPCCICRRRSGRVSGGRMG